MKGMKRLMLDEWIKHKGFATYATMRLQKIIFKMVYLNF